MSETRDLTAETVKRPEANRAAPARSPRAKEAANGASAVSEPQKTLLSAPARSPRAKEAANGASAVSELQKTLLSAPRFSPRRAKAPKGAVSCTMRDEADTEAFGRLLAAWAGAGTLIALTGELGTGKTTLTQGIAAGLGVVEPVTSPTYALIREYTSGRLPLYHFDVYRLDAPEALYDLGFEEYFFGGGVTVVEWADRVAETLPNGAALIRLEYGADATGRVYTVTSVAGRAV